MVEKNVKTAMVAAVAEALRFKEMHPKSSDEEVIGHILGKSDEILSKID